MRYVGPGLGLVFSLALVTACAVVELPPGGPVDTTPPHLVSAWPDSGRTAVGEVDRFVLTFSEKMERNSAVTWLHFFPDQRIADTRWHGAIEAEIRLEAPLPPDTLIVVEIAGGMKDAHKVASRHGRRFPIATGDSLYSGEIAGVLIMADSAVTNGVVELYATEPDSLAYFQRPLLRRTVTDDNGRFRFQWLPVPGGPWVLRAFTDPDFNLRPGERDAQRLLPDTLSVTEQEPTASAGVVTLYAADTPGRLVADPFAVPTQAGQVWAWAMHISESDTGWTARPAQRPQTDFHPLWPDSGGVLTDVPPGETRVVTFIDVDGDSTFNAVPDSLLGVSRPADVDTATWYLEPWGLVEGIDLEPGLTATFAVPSMGDSLVAWTAPPTATPADSVAAAAADSLLEALQPAAADTATAQPPPKEQK